LKLLEYSASDIAGVALSTRSSRASETSLGLGDHACVTGGAAEPLAHLMLSNSPAFANLCINLPL
jgi:hypothetical protein